MHVEVLNRRKPKWQGNTAWWQNNKKQVPTYVLYTLYKHYLYNL